MEQRKGLDSNAIKLIAILAMTIDHIAWAAFPGYPRAALPLAMHLIGRITCPVMCYFIAEGYHYTRDVDKYTARLFAFSGGNVLNQTSVMWSLAWGLVMLRAANSDKLSAAGKTLVIILICLVSFPSDWSCIASLCVLAFGTNRGELKKQAFWLVFYVAIYAAVYFFAIDRVYGLLQMGVVLALPVIRLYNGRRGRSQSVNRVMKWLFYVYYPLHLFVIGLIIR